MASSEDPDKPFKTLGHLYNYIYIIVCYRSGGWGLRLRRIGQDLDLGVVVSHCVMEAQNTQSLLGVWCLQEEAGWISGSRRDALKL